MRKGYTMYTNNYNENSGKMQEKKNIIRTNKKNLILRQRALYLNDGEQLQNIAKAITLSKINYMIRKSANPYYIELKNKVLFNDFEGQDLTQTAALALYESNGNILKAFKAIRQAIYTGEKAQKAQDLNLFNQHKAENNTEATAISNINVEEFYNKLNNKQRQILRLKNNGYSQSEIASKRNVSQQSISKELKKIKEIYKNIQEV